MVSDGGRVSKPALWSCRLDQGPKRPKGPKGRAGSGQPPSHWSAEDRNGNPTARHGRDRTYSFSLPAALAVLLPRSLLLPLFRFPWMFGCPWSFGSLKPFGSAVRFQLSLESLRSLRTRYKRIAARFSTPPDILCHFVQFAVAPSVTQCYPSDAMNASIGQNGGTAHEREARRSSRRRCCVPSARGPRSGSSRGYNF